VAVAHGRDLIEAELTDMALAVPVYHETERTDRAVLVWAVNQRNIHPRLHPDLAPEEPVQALLDLSSWDLEDRAPAIQRCRKMMRAPLHWRDLCDRSVDFPASRMIRSCRRTRRRAIVTVTPSRFAIAGYVRPCRRRS
jgi:hypothetical protein